MTLGSAPESQKTLPVAAYLPPLPPEQLGDPTFRAGMQDWINALWVRKDALIGELRAAA